MHSSLPWGMDLLNMVSDLGSQNWTSVQDMCPRAWIWCGWAIFWKTQQTGMMHRYATGAKSRGWEQDRKARFCGAYPTELEHRTRDLG